MIKITLFSGNILYAKDSVDEFSQIINAANNGRTAVHLCYRDVDFTQPVHLNIPNVETWEPIA